MLKEGAIYKFTIKTGQRREKPIMVQAKVISINKRFICIQEDNKTYKQCYFPGQIIKAKEVV